MSLLARFFTSVLLTGLAVSSLFASPTSDVAELKVNIRAWDVPTKGAKPYAVAVGPDGSIWFTEEAANKIGRLNPKTGEFKEYPLTEEKNAPHGLVADQKGDIWFAASSGGYIGKLEPNGGKITVFKMPDPKATDPDSLAFDSKGTLWFTVQNANMVGKLEPSSGAITLKQVSSPNARPSGILVLQRDIPMFTESGAGKLGSVIPDSFTLHEFPLPQGTRARRIAVAKNDNTLYFTDFLSGNLGTLDISLGAMYMLPTPGGGEAAPYGLTIASDGTVWYFETGVQPNNIIRYKPGPFTFSSVPVPFAMGAVRSMVAAPDGRIYFVSSDADKIGAVEIPQ